MAQGKPEAEAVGAGEPETMPSRNGAPPPFEVTELEKTDAPEGGTGQDWYRYVLHNGNATITGQRQGTREAVTAYATQFAQQLNARGFRGQSAWAPRSTRPGGSQGR